MNEETLKIGRATQAFLKRNDPGHKRAIPREKVFAHIRAFFSDLDDRQFRIIYTEVVPVCACEEGLFYPMKPEDLDVFEEYILKKLPGMHRRIKRVKEYYPHLAKDKGIQPNLF